MLDAGEARPSMQPLSVLPIRRSLTLCHRRLLKLFRSILAHDAAGGQSGIEIRPAIT